MPHDIIQRLNHSKTQTHSNKVSNKDSNSQ